jgi:AcrR family transcriptional regulator
MMSGSQSGGETRTQAERRAESEARLLRAALELIAVQGFAGTTVAQIGQEAGYSRGLVTQHFGSKLGLARSLVGLIQKGFEQHTVRRVAEVPDCEILQAWIDRYMAALEADSARYRAILALQAESITSLDELQPYIAALNEQVRAYLKRRLGDAQSRGEIPSNIDLHALVTAVLGMLRGTASQYLIDPENTDLHSVGTAAKGMVTAFLSEGASVLDTTG